MGVLNRVVTRLNAAPAMAPMLVRNLRDPGGKIADQPLPPDAVYVEVVLESLRLKKAQEFNTRCHGMIYGALSMSHDGAPASELAAIATPDQLADLNPRNLERVITLERQVLGPVPWHGGPLRLELGLFAVKSGPLLSPALDYVTGVSRQAGRSFLGGATPFLPLITEGLDLITGQTADVAIEIALDTELTLSRSEVMALVATERERIAPADLRLDPADRKLLCKGKPVEDAYCVLSIRRADQKADFGDIPELAAAYKQVRDALKTRRRTAAEEAKQALFVAIALSQDLIARDKVRLTTLIEETYERTVAGGCLSTENTPALPEHLGALPLYGDQ
ncbi:MAG: hypothetical protein AAGK92_09890 [Pseudomonadota bacterium]